MNGFATEAAQSIGAPAADWQTASVGDFSGGGQSDILWRSMTTGNTVIWQMNGFVRESASSVGMPSTQWQVR